MYICNTHVHMYFICIFEQIQLNFALVDLSLICMREEGSHCGLDSMEDKQIEQHSDKHTHIHKCVDMKQLCYVDTYAYLHYDYVCVCACTFQTYFHAIFPEKRR